MAKKEYAPLVSHEAYVFTKEHLEPLSIKADYKIMKDKKTTTSAVYCPKCNHVHAVKNRKREGIGWRYLAKFQCPNCGYRANVLFTNRWEEVLSADIFKMADGSVAVSLLLKIHKLFVANDYKTPMHVSRLARARYVFNVNGHTYYKDPYYIDTKRAVEKDKKSHIRPVTYMTSNSYCFPYFTWYMEELVKNGYLPKNAIARNRFRNVSEKMLRKIYTLLTKFNRNNSSFGRHIAKTVRMIDKEATDEDAFRILIKRANIKNAGKKFRRMMAEEPVQTYLTSLMFRRLKLKDINSFYKLDSTYAFHFESTKAPYFKLANIILEKYGEKALVAALSNANNKIFGDACSYIYLFKDILSEEMLRGMTHFNIKDTHNNLQKAYQEYREQVACDKTISSVAEKCDMIESGQIQQKYISAAKRDVIRTAEELINNPIYYEAEERKLEETISAIKFYLPVDTDHLLMAGDKLHNCVGHLYRMQAYRKQSIIVLMKQAEKFVGCIEIHRGKIKQAYGPCNSAFKPEAKEAFTKWTTKHKLSVTTTNKKLENIDTEYVVPNYEDIAAKIRSMAENITTPSTMVEARRAQAPF